MLRLLFTVDNSEDNTGENADAESGSAAVLWGAMSAWPEGDLFSAVAAAVALLTQSLSQSNSQSQLQQTEPDVAHSNGSFLTLAEVTYQLSTFASAQIAHSTLLRLGRAAATASGLNFPHGSADAAAAEGQSALLAALAPYLSPGLKRSPPGVGRVAVGREGAGALRRALAWAVAEEHLSSRAAVALMAEATAAAMGDRMRVRDWAGHGDDSDSGRAD